VDDVWAEKLVACPYCRQTVTAPAQTTLDASESITAARPMAPVRGYSPEGAPQPWPTPVATRGNLVAFVGFGLSMAATLLLMIAKLVSSPHTAEAQRFYVPGKSIMQAQREMLDFYGGNIPSWLVAAGLLWLFSLGIWLAALICSLIALRGPHRRAWAAAGLILWGVYPLLFCLPF
jgi:hypothetical protein